MTSLISRFAAGPPQLRVGGGGRSAAAGPEWLLEQPFRSSNMLPGAMPIMMRASASIGHLPSDIARPSSPRRSARSGNSRSLSVGRAARAITVKQRLLYGCKARARNLKRMLRQRNLP
jgi:hypothetical protein